MNLFLVDAAPESVASIAKHTDCSEAETCIDRLAAELITTTIQREEALTGFAAALELREQAEQRANLMQVQRDALLEACEEFERTEKTGGFGADGQGGRMLMRAAVRLARGDK